MMTPVVNVQLINFPNSGHEMVVPNEDGSYTILINARLSNEGQLQAYAHAMEHILNDDFEKQDVQVVEAVAHELSVQKPAPTEPTNAVSQESITHPAKRRRRRRNRKQEHYVQERSAFLMEHYDVFAIAEHNYLYGKDL